MDELFARIARYGSHEMGRPRAFIIAVIMVLVWGVCGPIFHYSDTWQLIINTGTTILTWLMIFLLQSSQNRDTMELNLKLDELIRSSDARNKMINLDELSEEQILQLRTRFKFLGSAQ